MTAKKIIPFTRVHLSGSELDYLRQTVESRQLAGDGDFTRRCERWLEAATGCRRAMLTHSCTAALEMAALLSEVGPGDEVIMPSFTFVSTANAFVLRGAVPVFVDIDRESLNLDPKLVEPAITQRTRAIVPVHYAGNPCDMDRITDIASRHSLFVIEDAAQGLMSSYGGRPLGSIGSMAALSFHQTKNVTSGEAGALLVNDPSLIERAEVIREKGTNRSRFHRGEVDKYTWIDIGSSYLPGELIAAFLFAQLENAAVITTRRRDLWRRYHALLEPLETDGFIERPHAGGGIDNNAHIYHILLPTPAAMTAMLESLKARGVGAVFHYVPLHSSPAGMRYGRPASDFLPVTDDISGRLLRLPLWSDMTDSEVDAIVDAVEQELLRGVRTR